MDLQDYREFYLERYGDLPSMKMVESFLHLYPEPDPTPEEFWQESEPELPRFELRRAKCNIANVAH